MKVRQIIIVIGFLLLIPTALLISRQMGNNTEQLEAPKEVIEPIRKVNSLTVANRAHDISLEITGRVRARNRYNVYTSVPGRMLGTSKEFRKGITFSKGDLLIKLDNHIEEINLKSRKNQLYNRIATLLPDLKLSYPEQASAWDAYLDTFDVDEPLAPLPTPSSNQEKRFISAKDIYNQYYQIRAEEERLELYSLRAPFSGQLTSTNVLPGAFVQAGQQLGEFTGNQSFDLETSINLAYLAEMKSGKKVSIQDATLPEPIEGRIVRIINKVEENTQSIELIITLRGKGLYDGMFLSGEVQRTQIKQAFRLNRSLLLEGNEVYVIDDGQLRKQSIKILAIEQGDAIVSGLTDGTILLNETSPNFQEGQQVSYQ